jgi:hypothetical protein
MLRARTPAVRTADVPVRSGYQEKCCFEDTRATPHANWLRARTPALQGDLREKRSHTDFLTRLDSPASAIKTALQKVWNAKEPLEEVPTTAISQPVQAKYATEEWNLRW